MSNDDDDPYIPPRKLRIASEKRVPFDASDDSDDDNVVPVVKRRKTVEVGKQTRKKKSAVVSQTPEDLEEDDQPKSRQGKRKSNTPTKRVGKASLGKQPKRQKSPPKRATPVPFIATELDPEYIDVTLEEFDELCKWPMNKWTQFKQDEFFC